MSSFVDFSKTGHNRCIVATCNLNQWALDFEGNLARIEQSIREAKRLGAKFRVGPELEVCGYSCEDHFRELDTYTHSAQSLAALLRSDATDGILCDIGMPIMHLGVRYNCRVFCLNRRIVLIRPKAFLANDGNYHEPRWFNSWKAPVGTLSMHTLCEELQCATGQISVPIGMGIIQTAETRIAAEVCEELWVSRSPHTELALAGVEIMSNGSASHHQLRKLNTRLSLIRSATGKDGGIYLYSNCRGCDGTRIYFDGSSLICVNGELYAQAAQFSLSDVEVITAVVDLDAVRAYRSNIGSSQDQATVVHAATALSNGCSGVASGVVDVSPFSVRHGNGQGVPPTASSSRQPLIHSPQEECALGPACWMWDYLRRSGASGYFLPLSGGADSASVAVITRVMCELAIAAAINGDKTVRAEVCRLAPWLVADLDHHVAELANNRLVLDVASEGVLTQQQAWKPASGAARSLVHRLCGAVLHTTYMGTVNSSNATRQFAATLAGHIGSYHCQLGIDLVVSAVLKAFSLMVRTNTNSHLNTNSESPFNLVPKFAVHGGNAQQDLALQNIQARIRMVMSYLCAALLPWIRAVRNELPGADGSTQQATSTAAATNAQAGRGFLLVLGSGNVDECLRGYLTKYDCSSADINPIGGICKADVKALLDWAGRVLQCPTLGDILSAPPTAELRPLVDDTSSTTSAAIAADGGNQRVAQTDEEDMGMTYAELRVFGLFRKVYQCGPLSMFRQLLDLWGKKASPEVPTHLAGAERSPQLTPAEIATKVKRFYFYYGINRHKMTTMTPSYHAENYSPDDNRFDMRPFLYCAKWKRQFANIDACVQEQEKLADTAVTAGQ